MNDYDRYKEDTFGWGKLADDGSELWDDRPTFTKETIDAKDWVRLACNPKKFVLYLWVKRAIRSAKKRGKNGPIRILDVGCGTGAAVIDMKKLFGRSVEVIGVDVVEMQVDIARERFKEYGVWAEVFWYDGYTLPFSDESIDVIYCCDVLGHVKDVPRWLRELYRVLKIKGALAMFAESKIGKHAFLRRYLMKKGVNIDPHAQFHISLYSKSQLRKLLTHSGFVISSMYSVFWAKFIAHPEEFYQALKKEKKLWGLRMVSGALSAIKKKTFPYSAALAEIYGLVEMLTIGRFVDSQGFMILAKKEAAGEKDPERAEQGASPQFAVDYSPNMRG